MVAEMIAETASAGIPTATAVLVSVRGPHLRYTQGGTS
jgi:hypothetical protein